jgi:chemotaxis protein methyltransferase CheR
MALIDESLEQEFNFSKGDFDRVRELIYRHAGISLHDGKQAMVYSRLSRRLRETGHGSFGVYLQALEAQRDPGEWQEFVNCLTTNLTSFFREDHHFVSLKDDIKAFSSRPLRIWCCAASTGEEPYSIAITCNEALGGTSQYWPRLDAGFTPPMLAA